MRSRRTLLLLPLGATLLLTLPSRAQAPARVGSPEVLPDHHVTFRLREPAAKAVRVVSTLGNFPMTKDESGVWSVTIGPLEPDFYDYHLTVDGTVMLDPGNPRIKSEHDNLLYVPGTPPRDWDDQEVPHGSLHVHWYSSPVSGTTRRMHIYTPPGYEAGGKIRYPVLYLLHGSGDDDSGWVTVGRANVILDNLIAQKKARPMLVVMPEGHIQAPGSTSAASPADRNMLYRRDLLEVVMPLVEASYRVQADASHRAIAGLSMGGGQSRFVGLAVVVGEKFRYVGVFSGGRKSDDSLTADPEQLKKKIKLIFISSGTKEGLKGLPDWLNARSVPNEYREYPGGHEWPVWRRSLDEMVPRLF